MSRTVYERRICVVCDGGYQPKMPNQKTCGHPRCIRENRRRVAANTQRATNERKRRTLNMRRARYDDPMPDKRTRDRVTLAWERARVLDGWDRITATAIASKQTVATTISVLRSVGVAV